MGGWYYKYVIVVRHGKDKDMKRTLIGALCLSLLAIGCSDQPQPETEQEPQPEVKQESQSVTPVETPDVQTETEEGTSETEVEKNIDAWVEDAFDELSKWLAVNEAIKEHDVETMRKLLKEGVDFTFQPDGNTYAAQCVLANFPDGLKVLKEFDFDFDMLNKRTGFPTLLIATSPGGDFNCLEMARILLECGASVDAEVESPEDPSLDGLTPLCLALHRAFFENDKESLEVAQFLLKHGADPDKTPVFNEGQTMLQTAIFKKNLPAVELLLKYGASITKERYDGVSALKIVAQRGTPAKIRQAVAANIKAPTFTIFGITVGQPLPKRINEEVFWVFDERATWTMPRPFRRFKDVDLERTVDSHRIVAITLSCDVSSELQREEEIQAVQEALEKKFGLTFHSAVQPWADIYWVEAYKDGAKIEIRSGPANDFKDSGTVTLIVSVEDEETLKLIDGLSAPSIETDLDVL